MTGASHDGPVAGDGGAAPLGRAGGTPAGTVRPIRIALAGISSESSTFSLGPTGRDRFQVLGGAELLTQYRFAERLGADVLDGVEFVPVLRAAGQSGGPIDPELYDRFVTAILGGLGANGPYDGVYLDMHGAMHVAGRDDAEEQFLEAVREVVGQDTVVAMSMDPHGNLTRRQTIAVDIAAVHRESPHVDAARTTERAVTDLVATIRSGRRPVKAWVRVPMLLPGERSGTFVEPGRTVFGAVEPVTHRDGVLDAGIWVGYYWADEPRNAGAVLVTGSDPAAVTAAAEELARTYWDARAGFGITAEHTGDWDDAIAFVHAGAPRPVFVSDSGDNWTGGADGDMTVALHATLEDPDVAAQGTRVLFAGLHDPDAVDAAVATGEGGTMAHPVGAWLSGRYAPPVPGPWRVDRIIDGRYGEGVVAALVTKGSVSVVVQRRRAVFTTPDDPAYVPRQILGQAWIDPSGWDAVVVKNGYLFPGQVEHAGSHFMALTPGGTDLDVDRLVYTRRARPLYPFDPFDDTTPDLTAELLPAWSRPEEPTP